MPNGRKPPGSMFVRERKGAPVVYTEIRAAVLRALREEGPMTTDEIVGVVLAYGIGNEGAVKRAVRYLGEDGKIIRSTTRLPWRVA